MKFTISHNFDDIPDLAAGELYYGEEEQHFGCFWRIYVQCKSGEKRGNKSKNKQFYKRLHYSLACRSPDEWPPEMFIKSEIVSRITWDKRESVAEKEDFQFGSKNLVHWKDSYFKEAKELLVEYEVEIKEKFGSGIVQFENIGSKTVGTQTEKNDTVVVVAGKTEFNLQKEFVCKIFDSLTLDIIESLGKPVLGMDVSPDIFRKILAILEGHDVLTDNNVDDVLRAAGNYEIEKALRECERFLIKNSKKSAELLTKIAEDYKLELLKHFLESKKALIPLDILECSVCYDSYKELPKVLPCGHTFCARCVGRVSGMCPTCRRGFNPESVSPNYELKNVIDFFAG